MVVADGAAADRVAVLDAVQGCVDQRRGGIGIEGEYQRAAAVAISTDGGAGNHHVAAGKCNRAEAATGAEQVVAAGAASAGNGQCAAIPVAGAHTMVQGLQVLVGQQRIAVNDDGRTTLNMHIARGRIEFRQGRRVIDTGNVQRPCDQGRVGAYATRAVIATIGQSHGHASTGLRASPGRVLAGAGVADLLCQRHYRRIGGVAAVEADHQIGAAAATDGTDHVAVVAHVAARERDELAFHDAQGVAGVITAQCKSDAAAVELGGVHITHGCARQELKNAALLNIGAAHGCSEIGRIVDRHHRHGGRQCQRARVGTTIGSAAIVLQTGDGHHAVAGCRVFTAVAVSQGIDQGVGLQLCHASGETEADCGRTGHHTDRDGAVVGGAAGHRGAVHQINFAPVNRQLLKRAIDQTADRELELNDLLGFSADLVSARVGGGKHCGCNCVLGISRVPRGQREGRRVVHAGHRDAAAEHCGCVQ